MNDFDDFFRDYDWIGLVVLIGIHLAFGIISARVASGKGRSAYLGFLAGFFLNVFGLIIVMLMSPSVEAEAQRRIKIEQEYEHQHRMEVVDLAFAAAGAAKEGEGRHRMTIPIQRVRYGDVVGVSIAVLSTRDQRARASDILRSEASTGALYFWPEGGTRKVQFLNPLSRIETRVAVVSASGEINEILTLRGGASAIEPTNTVDLALAFRASRFEEIGIDIGDQVLFPDEIRALAD